MGRSALVKLLGFRATLIHHDTLVWDRWRWLRRRLPRTQTGEKLLDVGCGSGAFSIGASLRGYQALGLTWEEGARQVAQERAKICKAEAASFEVLDVRQLDHRKDLRGQYDVVICLECVEHMLNDDKLMIDMANCLKPGGRLLLTTPYFLYRPIGSTDEGPFSRVEDGGHLRRGYSKAMLEELCQQAGLMVDDISFCSGVVSQKITGLLRLLSKVHPLFGWALILPLRILPPILDWMVTPLIRWPHLSICLEAYKPRFKASSSNLSGKNSTKEAEVEGELNLYKHESPSVN